MTVLHELDVSAPRGETIDERLRRVLSVHFDSEAGTPFWLERAAKLGIDPRRDVNCVDDLSILGEMSPDDLIGRPLDDFVPRRFHSRTGGFVLGQTGGTTGRGAWTTYRDDEFQEAFVRPFVVAAGHVGFPAGERWLYIGPSGPHIIGKAARHLAAAMGSGDPFSVDFDPRWARKMPAGSFARDRYTRHVVDQALDVIENQQIGVLFSTPSVLERLASGMSGAARERIRGVHYGGTAIAPHEMERFQIETFPSAKHLSGYGNTLFGCCLELSAVECRPLDYFPFGCRLILEVIDERGRSVAPGESGRVRFTRLDESMLIVRMRERDEAISVDVPPGSPPGYALPGVRNPRPPAAEPYGVEPGLY